MKGKGVKGKGFITFVMLLAMLMGLSVPAYGAQVDVTDSINPILSMEVTRQDPAVIGEDFTVVYSIKNISNKPAYKLNFDFSIEGIAEGDYKPITLSSANKPEEIALLEEGGSATISVKYTVDKDAKEKVYRLIGRLSCKNAAMQDAGTYTAMSSVGLSFTTAKPTLNVKDIVMMEAEPDLANGFNITIKVKNGSLIYDLRNVEFQLDGGDNFEVMDISNKKSLNRISTNEEVGIQYKLREKENRASNSLKLSMGYSYSNGSVNLKDNVEELFLPLPVESSGNGTVPRVIIKKYSLSKDQVLAGDRVDLTLSIENTNQKPVRNVLISFGAEKITSDSGTSSGTVFSPVNSSNTFHLDEIKGKTVVNKTITFYVDPSATAKTYLMPVTISYENSKGVPVDTPVTDSVNIPVTQEAKLQIMTVNIPSEAMVGMPTPVTAEFANSGKVDLTEFSVSLEGNFESQDASMYLAKLAIGATNSYAGMIIPQEEGTLEGKLIFSYTDNNNQVVTREHPFTMNVGPAMDMNPDGGMIGPDGKPLGPDGMPMDDGSGSGLGGFFKQHWLSIVLIAGLLGEAIYIIRIKKKAKEEFFDE